MWGIKNPHTHPDALFTVDGYELRSGVVVWTNNLRPGVVDMSKLADDGWFDVIEQGETRGTMQNAERVACSFEGRKALDAITDLNWLRETVKRVKGISPDRQFTNPYTA